MASNPPGRCCTIGVKHEGKSVGEIKPLNGIPTYITRPESKDTTYGVLILPDVIGHEFVNVQLVADQLAANGYLTVVPDLFEGDPVPLNRPDDFNLQGWLKGHQPDKVDPIVEKAIDGMKKDLGVKHIAAIGYCFGARYVARFAAKGKGIDVGYMAHPSFVSAEELKGVAAPLSIAAAETDEIFPAEKRHESEDILKGMDIPYQVCLYSGVVHGFAVRGDMSDRVAKFAKEAAFLQAVQWFDEFLKGKREGAA